MTAESDRDYMVAVARNLGVTEDQAEELADQAVGLQRGNPRRPRRWRAWIMAPVDAVGRNRADLATVAGLGFLSYGLWLVYEPAAHIVGGALVLLYGILYGILQGVASERDLDRAATAEAEPTDRDPGDE